MSAKIKRNYNALQVLKKASPQLRKAILANSNHDLVLALCEIIANTLSGTVHLKPSEKTKLKRHTSALRKIVDNSVKVKEKKQILVQKGGFLNILLPPALALLSSLLT
jgi:hypothetical protein